MLFYNLTISCIRSYLWSYSLKRVKRNSLWLLLSSFRSAEAKYCHFQRHIYYSGSALKLTVQYFAYLSRFAVNLIISKISGSAVGSCLKSTISCGILDPRFNSCCNNHVLSTVRTFWNWYSDHIIFPFCWIRLPYILIYI